MTKTTSPRTCYLCEIAPATALKTEDEMSWEGEPGNEVEVLTPITRPICDGCAEWHFDGTENHPGVKPLQ